MTCGALVGMLMAFLAVVGGVALTVATSYFLLRDPSFVTEFERRMGADVNQDDGLREAALSAAAQIQRSAVTLTISTAALLISVAGAFLALRRLAEPVAREAQLIWDDPQRATMRLGPVTVHNVTAASDGWRATVRYRGRRVGWYPLKDLTRIP